MNMLDICDYADSSDEIKKFFHIMLCYAYIVHLILCKLLFICDED